MQVILFDQDDVRNSWLSLRICGFEAYFRGHFLAIWLRLLRRTQKAEVISLDILAFYVFMKGLSVGDIKQHVMR